MTNFGEKLISQFRASLDVRSQDTPEGQAMREWIVNHVKPLNREKMIKKLRTIA